eukprot:g2452.t1
MATATTLQTLLAGAAAGFGIALFLTRRAASASASSGVKGLRHVSDVTVRRTLSMARTIAVNREAFLAHHRGGEEVIVPRRIVMRRGNGSTLFKPAAVGSSIGLKVVSVRPSNAERGLPTVPAVMVLLDDTTGAARMTIDATWLTAMRTAAGSALATDTLAAKHSKILVVFGAGLQAEAHIIAMLEVRNSVKEVIIVNRTEARGMRLVSEMRQKFPSCSFCFRRRADASLVRSADIICCCTNSSSPLFDGNWLSPSTHVNAVGSYTPEMQEVDETTVSHCDVVCLDTLSAEISGDISVARTNGALDKERITTLGALLSAGTSPPHLSPTNSSTRAGASARTHLQQRKCTLFKSVGVAFQDIATADAVAREIDTCEPGS